MLYIYFHFCSKLIAEDLSRLPFSSSAFPVVGGLFLALFDAATPEIKRLMWLFMVIFHLQPLLAVLGTASRRIH